MSVIPVLEYLGGLGVFGLVKLVMNDVVDTSKTAYTGMINGTPIESKTFYTGELMTYIWVAIVLLYLLIGGFVLWRKYTQPKIPGFSG